MMRRIKKYNIASKLMALVGAATLWFFVASGDDQSIERQFNNLVVEVSGQEILQSKGFVILEGGSPRANITLLGPISKLTDVINDVSLIKVWIDVSSLNPGKNEVRLNAYLDFDNSGITIAARNPQSYVVVVDRIIDKPVPVELELTGDPAGSYRINSNDIWPTMVTLTGPETYLRDIKCARVSYDVSGITDSDSISLTFELIKEDDSIIEESKLGWIKSDVASIELALNVRRDSTVNLRVTFTGIPEYINEDAIDHRIDPGSISISGDPSDVEMLNYIDLGEINIKNVIESGVGAIERTVTLPNGVSSPMNGKDAVVYISFPGYGYKVMTFTQSDLPPFDRVTYEEQEIEVRLFGLEEDLALVRPEDIVFTPALGQPEPETGEYAVSVSVTCNVEGVAVLGKHSITVNVSEPEPTTVPENHDSEADDELGVDG